MSMPQQGGLLRGRVQKDEGVRQGKKSRARQWLASKMHLVFRKHDNDRLANRVKG